MVRLWVGSVIGVLLLSACNPSGGDNSASAGDQNTTHANIETAPAVADEIERLERRWSQAFVNKDHEFIESIVAPDFKLIVFDGGPIIVPRSHWMMNTRKWDIEEYSENVLDVAVRTETAVATVEGTWRVVEDGEVIREDSFFLTDTWVRDGDSWQVIRRHSQTTQDNLYSE